MKTKILILTHVLLLSIIFFLSSCSKKPTANFSYVVYANSDHPGRVEFVNSSTDATSYTWDFGDGTTSTEKDIIHDYADNKDYTVKLTAKGKKKSADATQSVTVGTAFTKVYITTVNATVPLKNASNNDWDPADPAGINSSYYQPDTYAIIKNSTSTLNTQASPTMDNYFDATYNLPTNALIIDKANWANLLTLELWDQDVAPDTDDLIGTTTLNLSTYATGTSPYPISVKITAGGIEWNVFISWKSN